MERIVTVDDARRIMGHNFIGADELQSSFYYPACVTVVPEIPYLAEELEEKKNDYLLILGVSTFNDGKPITIRVLIELFGDDPSVFEPCFYNQDWYLKEDFIDAPMPEGWFLIRRRVFEDSRAIMPDELVQKHQFPLAIRCVYSFFTAWFCLNERLWWHDFVWCSDCDHNGDRIYVGKYNDVDGVNKNGFSIHRHLALRSCYGAID